MAQKWVCDLVGQLLEDDGQGIYDYFLNRRSFLKSYYKDFDMRAFIGEKLNDILNDPKNYDDASDRLTVQGRAQLRNEIITILENEQALINRLSKQYDINSVSMFTRMEKWSQTPKRQWSVWEDNLIRGYEGVKEEVYYGLKSSLDTEVTLKSGRNAVLTANQMFEREDFQKAFNDLVIDGAERLENVDASVAKQIIAYNKSIKAYLAQDSTIGDVNLATAGMAFSPNVMARTDGGMELFGDILLGNKRRNFTTKEINKAVEGFVNKHKTLFRSEGDARDVGYMLMGKFDAVSVRTKEIEMMANLHKTPQGKFRFFNRLVNQGYIDKEGLLKISKEYRADPRDTFARMNGAISTDVATTKMFGKKPFQALDNAKKIAETVLNNKEKAEFNKVIKRMEDLLNTMFNPGKADTMDNKMFMIMNTWASALKASKITGAGIRTMGDASLGGLKSSMFTGERFVSNALKGIGITGLELEGKAIRALGEGTKKVAPQNLAQYVDAITNKFDFSYWNRRMTERDRRELTESMIGGVAEVVTSMGIYDGTWIPLSDVASRKGFKENGIKGGISAYGSNFSGLQLKETIGNVLAWKFSKDFRQNLVKYESDEILAKYMDDLGFTKDARDLYRKLGGHEDIGASLDIREHGWFHKRGKEYKEFMHEFFVPKDLDKLRPEQIGNILDTVSSMEEGDLLKFDNEGVLDQQSVALVLETMATEFPKTFKKNIEPKDFVIQFKPDRKSAHVKITSDGFLKGGFAEDSDIRLALRQSYEIVRQKEMRAIKERMKLDYLKDGKIAPSKRNEVREMLNELYGIKKQSSSEEVKTIRGQKVLNEEEYTYNFGKKSDNFVANYYLDKFKDFERAIFYEFASVKPSMEIRLMQDRLKKQDNRVGFILSNALAFKSASLDSLYKYTNLVGKMASHMKEGKMFSGRKMAQYADALTALGIIAFVNGIAGDLYDKAVDKDKGDVVDAKDLTREGAKDVVGFALGSVNPSAIQTSFGRVTQQHIGKTLGEVFSNDLTVNKFTKDLLGEVDTAYGINRKKEKLALERKRRGRERAKARGLVNPITGKLKTKDRR